MKEWRVEKIEAPRSWGRCAEPLFRHATYVPSLGRPGQRTRVPPPASVLEKC